MVNSDEDKLKAFKESDNWFILSTMNRVSLCYI